MIWSWTLWRYLAIQFATGVLSIYLGFLFLAFSLDVAGLISYTTAHHVPTMIVIGMAVLQLPDLGLKLMPFAVLLGGVFAFVRLSRSQELIAVRAAGVSAWSLLAPSLVVAVLLGICTVLLLTPLTARMLNQYSAMEAKYIRGQESQLAISRNGLWLRQGDSKAQSVIHALRVTNQGLNLEDVIIFLYGPNDKFEGRIDAHSGVLGSGIWTLKNAWISTANGKSVHRDTYNLQTTLTPAQIQESFASPETMSFWDLPGFIAAARKAGFSATRYMLYFDSLLVLPALFAAMVFMAASFSLHMSRFGGLLRVILNSALAGFGVYLFANIATALGDTGILPVALAASAPAAVSILLGMTLVFHQEDG
jgi:lipopolysaccharide export system permease protein